MARVKHIAFTLYRVKDMARAREFYERGLGLRLTCNFRDRWVEYHLDNGCFALTSVSKYAPLGASPGAGIAFEVDDLDAVVGKLRAEKAVVQTEPFSTTVCRMAVVLDPEGNAVVLHVKNPGR